MVELESQRKQAREDEDEDCSDKVRSAVVCMTSIYFYFFSSLSLVFDNFQPRHEEFLSIPRIQLIEI